MNDRARALEPSRLRSLLIFTVRHLLRAITSVELRGLERVPRAGPLLIVANHRSNMDSFFLYTFIPRLVRFMTKEEVFVGPLRPAAWWFGGFPVRRGQADRRAIRMALDLLAAGECVGMFPEGKRSHDGRLGTAHPGIGLLATRSGATILPVGISGTEAFGKWTDLLRRPRIRLSIGAAFALPRNSVESVSSQKATELIMARIAALLPAETQGSYATSPGQLAPRA